MTARTLTIVIVLILSTLGLAVAGVYLTETRLQVGLGAMKHGKYQEAYDRLYILAVLGNSSAQSALGKMYAYGWGVPKDENEALGWFRRAESENAATAAYLVGRDYSEGVAIPKNEVEAVKWFKIAAENGSTEAAEKLSRAYAEGLLGLPQDQKQSEYWHNRTKAR